MAGASATAASATAAPASGAPARGVADIVRSALAEDLGAGDVTAAATVPAGRRGRATITQKERGVIYGLEPAVLALFQVHHRERGQGVTSRRIEL